MRTSDLLARNLRWHWRTNLAVLLGVATATGVLGGALLVGESVRGSLRDIALARLGNVENVISRNGFVREELASAFPSSAPVIAAEATAWREGGRRVTGVEVYGVDERFRRFQRLAGQPPAGREAVLTPALARELGVNPGETVLLRVRKPSSIPSESLHGRKDDLGMTLRMTAKASDGTQFSLQPRQGELKAVYVSLARLQRDFAQMGKVNAILLEGDADAASRTLKARATLADIGLSLRTLPLSDALSLESESAIVSDRVAQTVLATASSLGLRVQPVLTYLANRIGLDCGGTGENCPAIPYSVVTALDSELAPRADDGIVLNDWTARNLRAKPGDTISLEYFVWKPEGLARDQASFRLERIVPLAGPAADRDFAPRYPGITDSMSLRDWNPPFPLDLARVRPADESYWAEYRATPKAFLRLARGRQLWGTRYGSLTSIRVSPPSDRFGERLLTTLDPQTAGLSVIPLRANVLEAARGATNFSEYFLYFSFFLIVSALLLTGLFFKLGVEQRAREIGILRSLGFSLAKLRGLLLLEGGVLALAGAALGVATAIGYCEFLLVGLRTWWIGAVGTRSISLHASLSGLGLGAAAGVVTGLASVAWALRSLSAVTPRGLVTGQRRRLPANWGWTVNAATVLSGGALGYAAFLRKVDATAGFFGAGTLLLGGALLCLHAAMRGGRFASVKGKATLGLRNLSHHPGRTILCVTLIASATFSIVSLDTFRREESSPDGAGGYRLLATSNVPLIYDPNTAAGRNALNLEFLPKEVDFVPFRLKPGDDASCQNLYRPLNPRILAPPGSFLRGGRFAFDSAVRESANPWLLLDETLADGAIPAIADVNSMTYTMRLKLGEEFRLNGVRYRIVAALRDSIFQGELLISEANFLRLFPDAEGYRFFLVRASVAAADRVARDLEDALSDYGFEAEPSAARLADFHRVENTYLSTFRALGGLGLILGTVGLGAILLRNVLERRREFALLRAVGYRRKHLAAMVLVENASMLLIGVAMGAACGLLAVMPAVSARGGRVPLASVAALLCLVLVTGLVASLVATSAALRAPLLETLKAE